MLTQSAKSKNHQKYTRFAIVGHARTGSNFLFEALDQLDTVQMNHEVYAHHNRDFGENFEGIWNTVFSPAGAGIRAVGFKVFYYHLSAGEWSRLARDRELKVVHLLRRNRLRTLLSLELAHRSDVWSVKYSDGDTPEPETISIDAAAVLGRLEHIAEMELATRNRFSQHAYMEIFYEDMIRRGETELARVVSFLGQYGQVDPERISIRKQNVRSLADTIENFNEVAAVLQSTTYADYLHD